MLISSIALPSICVFCFAVSLWILSDSSVDGISFVTFLSRADTLIVAELSFIFTEPGVVLLLAVVKANSESFKTCKSFKYTPGWSKFSSNSVALLLSGSSIGIGIPRLRRLGMIGKIG